MLSGIDQPLNYLDLIPDILYQRLVTLNYRSDNPGSINNNLKNRSECMLALRDKLLRGQSPLLEDFYTWLDDAHLSFIHESLSSRELLSHTEGNESYTDDVLLNVLQWLEAPDIERLKEEKLDNIQRTTESSSAQSSALNQKPHNTSHDNLHTEDIKQTDYKSPELHANENVFNLMHDINKRFALQRSIGWDLTKGINSSTDAKELIRIHQVVKESLLLQSVIKLIGRGKAIRHSETDEAALNHNYRDKTQNQHKLPDENAVNSVTGVCLGDDLARMLPTELAFLGHKQLKMLWHSRRAEHQLLNYHFRGVLSEKVPVIDAISVSPDVRGKSNVEQQGPVVICMDTSASMQGSPELTAKAIALETMRVCRIEGRPCYLFCFSGPDEIDEIELDLKHDGWQSIITLLNNSFHGGTDINQVLNLAMDKLQDNHWNKADILLVSDGRFKVTSDTVNRSKSLDQAARFIGIQVSRWNSLAFGDFCHRLFTINNV